MAIKYRYAIDEERRLVDVQDLTEADRKDYECLSCGHVLRPVMGEVRRKHFRHQEDTACSGETYLHLLGKRLFRRVYRRCLDTGSPFEIELERSRVCTLCAESGAGGIDPRTCEVGIETEWHDLAAHYPNIVLETPDDGFIPDLMLSNEWGEKVYVEIAVTHESTERKRRSGHCIIELAVEREADLEIIKSCRLSEENGQAALIGFDLEPESGDFSGMCGKAWHVFSVRQSGEAHLERKTIASFQQEWRDESRQFIYAFVESACSERPYGVESACSDRLYGKAVLRAYQLGLRIKNCLLCRHHRHDPLGIPLRGRTAPSLGCDVVPAVQSVNEAVTCEHYQVDDSVRGLRELVLGKVEFFRSLGCGGSEVKDPPDTHRYALGEGRRLVDAQDLTEADRGDYECLACGRALRPVIEGTWPKHFRHQVDGACSGETSLHRLAKHLFRQVYGQCLEAGKPFEIELLCSRRCTACEEGPCTIESSSERHDLTRYFRDVVLASGDGGPGLDLVLSGSQGEKVSIEVVDPDDLTEEKRGDGPRTIELAVGQDADLGIIETRLLSEKSERVAFRGFDVGPENADFSDECVRTVPIFYLWSSGKTYLETQTVASFRRKYLDERMRFYFTFVLVDNRQEYIEALERAYLKGLNVKNCYLCRYHREPNARQRRKPSRLVFCKLLKETHPSVRAADCEHYRPDASVFREYPDGTLEGVSESAPVPLGCLIGDDKVEGEADTEERTARFTRTPFFRSRGMVAFMNREKEQR